MTCTFFHNGRFCTLDPHGPPATALLARDNRIVALGEMASGPADAEAVDLGGRTAIPGPVDAHCHLVSYGMIRLREADLRGARSLAEIAVRLQEQAARQRLRPGEGRWLLGRGFDQELLEGRRWPTRHDLDR